MSVSDLEYSSLRHTIAQRGTVRIALLPLGILGWAALATTVILRGDGSPVTFVFPLLVLTATFEAVHALHAGVERVGRYLQLRYEAPSGPRWESTAMAVGPALPGGGVDPLFTMVFVAATLANMTAVALATAAPLPIVAHAVLHALLLVRVARARRAAARQRAVELARMSEVLRTTGRNSGHSERETPAV
jgi:hypothetical protein